MRFTPRVADPLVDSLEAVAKGLGMELVELSQSRFRGAVRIRAVVCGREPVGLEHCSRLHHALSPRLELAFPGREVYLEVSSPGIDRLIKDGSEFVHYIGRGIKCYRRDISDWSGGILTAADSSGIILKSGDEEMKLKYELIAKAKLDYSQEVEKLWQRI
ncbi:MAG: ribosome assembly cofactor RimP [Spirochaetaceae bacterium]|nr:ribosome assembly cofactor RimP [Spirochaetaceae bacterium]